MSTYRTQASVNLMDVLTTQEKLFAKRLERATDPFDRGITQGYLDCLTFLVSLMPDHLERIETDAELVPSAEAWLEQNMAGDFRDMPA